MFDNRRWELPEELGGRIQPDEELTLWKVVKLTPQYPEIPEHPNKERTSQDGGFFSERHDDWKRSFKSLSQRSTYR